MLKQHLNAEEPHADLKQTFLRYLPERMDAIVEGWFSLAGKSWNSAKLAQILQRVQDLSSVANKIGFIKIHQGLKPLGQCLQALLDIRKTPTPQQIQQINNLVHRLRPLYLIDDNVEDSVLGTGIKIFQILYLCNKEDLAPGLAGAISELRWPFMRFTQITDLSHKINQGLPSALIIDAAMLDQIAPLLSHIAREKVSGQEPLVLIVLSQSNTFELRLQALRVGAAAFFSTPIDPQAVTARLRRLITPLPEMPYRILIMDDNFTQAEFTSAILRKGGLEVRIATEPLQFFEILETFRPDLVLMDLYMPNVDGIELTKIIREQISLTSLPIVFISGEQDADKQLDALKSGGDDFVTKPVRPHHLLTTVKSRILRARAFQITTDKDDRDPITGLLNRHSLFEKIEQILARGSRDQISGLICIEIDGMESIRETVGTKGSDALLVTLGAKLLSHLAPEDLCAHIDDNRFAVLAMRTQKQDLVQLSENLVQTISKKPIAVEGLTTPPTLSAGLYLFNSAPEDVETLEQRAIAACGLAREKGGQRLAVQSFIAKTQTAPQPINILETTKHALRTNQIQVLFQTFIGMRDRHLEIHEMQWRIPIPGGQITAADTLNAIKSQPGLSLEIDRWVTIRALDVLREQRQTGRQAWLLVPQTVETLINPKTAMWLREELRQRLLVGTGLIFKFNLVDLVTDIKSARNLLGDLSIMGIEMCLDRFGHNEASYKVLRYLKMPYVKITDKLLTASSDIILTVLKQTQEVNARVILPKILDPKTIAKEWLTGADFVQSGNARD